MPRQIEVTQPDGTTETHAIGAAETDTAVLEDPAPDEPQAEQQPEVAPADPAPEPEAEDVTVTIGDEPPAEPEQERAPEWVRELRRSHRELQRKVREYEESSTQATQPAARALGPKPTLEGHEYDTDRYETALEAWYRQRDQIEAEKREQERQAEEQKRAWQAKLEGYGKAKGELKVQDFDDAEALVQESLNITQQGIVLQGAENPALVVYALGKNPKRAKELAAITDPVRFAFAVAKLEAQLKVAPRSKPPAPEKPMPSGTAPVSGSSDTNLERLREEAARTGDFSKVVRYKAQLRAKQK